MNIDETIDNLLLALDLCCDGGPSPFTSEQYEEMRKFLESQRTPERGKDYWVAGKEPRWKVGDILAYYECTTDHEGECIIGGITTVEFDEYLDDWFYGFDNGTSGTEESLSVDDCYTISRDYYERHRKHE